MIPDLSFAVAALDWVLRMPLIAELEEQPSGPEAVPPDSIGRIADRLK